MNALKILAELDYNAKRDLYQNVPEYAIAKTKFEDKTANGLTRCILQFLQLKNHWATRINTTGRLLQGKEYTDVLGHRKQMKSTWIKGTTKKGTADIHAVLFGKHASLEVKISRDKMSKHQIATKEQIESSGGLYYVAKDFESFYAWYNRVRVHNGNENQLNKT